MFEYDQQIVDELLRNNDEFKRLYEKHWYIDQKLIQASKPVVHSDEMTLAKLKKEKLHIKDRLAVLLSQYRGMHQAAQS